MLLESSESRLAVIERTVADLEQRLRALEHPAHTPPAAEPFVPSLWHGAPRPDTDLASVLTLIGRTLVIFGGGYLLRALTEAGTVSVRIGAAVGLVYAATWLMAAYWAAPRAALSATFFGSATVLIGFPLLWEATERFTLVSPAAGAAVLAALTGAVLWTAWRRDLHALAWIATLAATLLASALLVATDGAVVFTLVLIGLGVATLWLGYDREWTLLRWWAAPFANVASLALVGRAMTIPPRDEPAQVMAVQLLLLVGYLGSIAVRTLLRGRDVIAFEVVQTAMMLATGFAGALILAHAGGFGATMLAAALLALAVGGYAIEFIDRRRARGANRYFYTSLGLVFALTGAELFLDGAALGLLWAAFAVSSGWAGHRHARLILAVHSVIYLAAAATAGGFTQALMFILFASADVPWPAVPLAGWVVMAALGACWAFTAHLAASEAIVRGLRGTLAVLVVLSSIGVAMVGARAGLLLASGTVLPAGMLATLRTGALALGAIAVAWLGRRASTAEFGPLLYPVLAWGGVKLLFEDFRGSPPLLLFVAFAFYGGALIAGPRVAKNTPAAHLRGTLVS